jgi:hypothetical protein
MARGDRVDLVNRLKDRGVPGTDARLQELVNQAASEVLLEWEWHTRKQLVASTGGAAAAKPAGGWGRILSVVVTSTGRTLEQDDEVSLRESYQNLDQQGEPSCWYFDLAGDIETYPKRAAETISVRCYSGNAWTTGGLVASGDADTPKLPDAARELVVILAHKKSHLENGRADLAGLSEQEYSAVFERILNGLPSPEPMFVRPLEGDDC